MRALAWVMVLGTMATGCASGDDDPPGGGDGGAADAGGEDGGGRADAGRRDAGGGVDCPAGQHRCGGGCIDDQPNEPDNGCRLGCGEPCPTGGEFGVAACSEAGACTFECEPPSVREGEACVCHATTCAALGASCGTADDGCGGTLECGVCEGGTDCIDGTCGCTEDAAEPNDARTIAFALPPFTDAPDTSMTFAAFNVSDAADTDWYRFSVTDAFDAGNPQIRVTLDMIPPGSNYDLGVWYVCASGGDSTTCRAGAPDNMIGRGCSSSSTGTTSETVELATECSGTNDSGTVFMRVVPTVWGGSCAPYRLQVDVR